MLWLAENSGGTSGSAAAVHHTPVLVELLNHHFGEPVHHFQMKYTHPFWQNVLGRFDTTPEAVFGAYTPETAIPWYTVMFVIACLITMIAIWVLKGKLSEDDPTPGQQTLEAGVLAIEDLLTGTVGKHALKYFPVIATFGVLILVSNLMGQVPGLMSPTASTSVTLALGISSFAYYNYIGIRENGLFGHLSHFAGPLLLLAPLLFPIELISNIIRPISLGIRLFGNMFADEQVIGNITNLAPPYTNWIVPVALMPLGVFVAFIQTFIFVFLSIVYISEVSHPPHDEHHDHAEENEQIIAPVLT
ncbi:MAG: F0F1 ATP synthase subunit A [Pyrinomonadaceae bacterium]